MDNFTTSAASVPTMVSSLFWFGTIEELIFAGVVCFCLYHFIQRFSLKDPWKKITVFLVTTALLLPIWYFILRGTSPYCCEPDFESLPTSSAMPEISVKATGEDTLSGAAQESHSNICRSAEFDNQTLVDAGLLDSKAKSKPEPQMPSVIGTIDLGAPVAVQTIVDPTTGEVVSACSISGDTRLRKAAENAARKTRFLPTNIDG